MQTLLEKFIDLHPDFLLQLERLSGNNKAKFIRNFKKESQEVNFLATVSEFRFAQFLESESIDYEYEPTVGQKRPDFLLRTADKKIVYFEVKRFNASDFDKHSKTILSEFSERLKSIKKPYHVLVEKIEKELNFDTQLAFSEIEKWILQNDLRNGNSYNYKNLFRILIYDTNGIKDYVLCSFSGGSPKIHPSKLLCDILRKVKAYREAIIDKGFPFFVGIDLEFDTIKDPSDYWLQFVGWSCLNSDTGIESFDLGEFYTNSELDGLAGILIRFNNQFYWLNNPRSKKNIEFRFVKTNYE